MNNEYRLLSQGNIFVFQEFIGKSQHSTVEGELQSNNLKKKFHVIFFFFRSSHDKYLIDFHFICPLHYETCEA